MAQSISTEDLRGPLQEPKEHLLRSLVASVGKLICALQKRHLPEARRIAAELARDLCLCDCFRAQYWISRIISLLTDEHVFDRCDELSVWLLFVEQEVESLSTVGPARLIHPRSVEPSLLKPDIPISKQIAFGDPMFFSSGKGIAKGII